MDTPDEAISQPAPRAIITIRLEASGAVNVNFPTDPILAYGLLEQARCTLDRHFTALNAPRVIPANGIGPAPMPPMGPRRLLG